MSKIKCTYQDCFKHFADEKAMIRHKVKDDSHSYCKACDVDCEDDMFLFIHQLASPNHICCPICALEFKSISGRDVHLTQSHRGDSLVACAGCEEKFAKGSTLMFHIEQDECPIIRVRDFQVQRAERQLNKDAWEAEAQPHSINPSTWEKRSQINTNARSDLLEAGTVSTDGISTARGPRSIPPDQFPSLSQSQISNKKATAHTVPQSSVLGAKTNSNLIDLNSSVAGMSKLQVSQKQSWGFQESENTAPDFGSNGRIKGWLHTVNSTTEPPNDNETDVASMYDRKASELSSVGPSPTPVFLGQNTHRHIMTMPAHSTLTSTSPVDMEKYFDPTLCAYVCPSPKCKKTYNTVDEFKDHLLDEIHAGGKVTCPSCLKKFATTSAWVAHTESASKRCDIRKSVHYNQVMREITGGVLGTEGLNENGTVKFVVPKIEEWCEVGDLF